MIFPMIHFVKDDEQLLIESPTTRTVFNGPGRYTSKPFERINRRKGEMLGPTDYIRVRNTLTGELRNERGPQLYFLEANEEVDSYEEAYPLKANQYLKIMDTRTGTVRVERGETTVYIEPTEELVTSTEQGIDIDEHKAVPRA